MRDMEKKLHEKKYGVCDMKYFIVMKKLPETTTNEQREDVVDADHAKFRASILQVELIVNIEDINDRPNQILNSHHAHKTMYTVGENIVPSHEFYDDIDKVCAGGISYFKTIEMACTYNRHPYTYLRNVDYVENWTSWYKNGQKRIEYTYDGQFGYLTTWHKNGEKEEEGKLLMGKLEGRQTAWHKNGQKRSEGEYRDGIMYGYWGFWHRNGQKHGERAASHRHAYETSDDETSDDDDETSGDEY